MTGEEASDQQCCSTFGKADDGMHSEHQQQDGLQFRLAGKPQLHGSHERGNHTRRPAAKESTDRTALVPTSGGVPFEQAKNEIANVGPNDAELEDVRTESSDATILKHQRLNHEDCGHHKHAHSPA